MPIRRILAISAALALLGTTALVAYHESSYRALARGLDDDVAALRRLQWERPVLRGSADEGNAAEAAQAALASFAPLSAALQKALAERVYYGQPPSPSEQAAIAEREPALRALRAATQRGWAFNQLALERGRAMAVPDYPRLVDAALCLLADARRGAAAECLRSAADVIRLGQDQVPGAPLEAANASARLTSLAARVVPRCAQDADLASLRRSVRELQVLAAHPPPTGSGIELHELARGMELRERLALTNKAAPAAVARALLERPQLLSAWSELEHPTRFRKLGPDNYPDATEQWKREQEYSAASAAPLTADERASVLDALREDMRGQALLRMLVVGTATLAERAYRGKLPARPAMLDDPELVDPFRGSAFSFRVSPPGSPPELTLWSVGEDNTDDNGSSEWREHAPIDVVLRFPIARTAN